jgi:hypothetical protein
LTSSGLINDAGKELLWPCQLHCGGSSSF